MRFIRYSFREQFVRLFLCSAIIWLSLSASALAAEYPESAHPYASNSDISWSYRHAAAADYLKITFSESTEFESGCDVLYITDADGNEQRYSGTDLTGDSIYLPGNSFTLRLVSDSSVNRYGFAITDIKAATQAEYQKYISTPKFTINSSGVITAYRGQAANLVIPPVIDGVKVTGIGSAVFSGHTDLISVSLLDGVTEIGGGAFEECSSLTSINLPAKLTSIEYLTFSGCSSLTSVHLPDGVTKIGWSAFSGCHSLTTINLPPKLTSIGASAFLRCLSLTGELVIPDSVETIGDHAFAECQGLTGELVLPAGLTGLGKAAFDRCPGLMGDVVIPSGITAIPEGCFGGCGIQSIQLHGAVTSIGYSAFTGCTSLEAVTVPSAKTTIDLMAFDNCPNLELHVKSGSAAETAALENEWNYLLTDSYTISPSNQAALYIGWPETLRVLDGSGAQVKVTAWSSSNPSVASVTAQGVVTAQTEGSATIRAKLASGAALEKTYSVKAGTDESYFEYTVSSGKATITGYSGEDLLLVIPPTLDGYPVARLDGHAFRFANCQRVYIPASVTEIGTGSYGAFNRCYSLKEFRVAEGSIFYTIDGVLFGGNDYVRGYGWTSDVLVQYPYARSGNSYAVPDGIKSLANEAFETCDLEHIVLPESLLVIGSSALEATSLKEIYLPASVRYIDSSALGGLRSVDAIEVSAKNEYFVSVDGVLYSRDMKTLVAYPSGKTDERFVVPDGVTAIGAYACEETQFHYISFPDTLTTIRGSAFWYNSLRELYFPDSLVEIDDCAFMYCWWLQKAVIPAGVQDIGHTAFFSAGEWSEDGCAHFYFEHSAGDSITIEPEEGFVTIPESAVIFAQPGGDVQAFAELTNVPFASLANVEADTPQLMNKGDTAIPLLSADGYPMRLPVEWSSTNKSVLAVSGGTATASAGGSAELRGVISALNIGASQTVIVQGGKQIVLPEAAREIEAEAFAGSTVREVICGKNIRRIGSRAFADCPSLYMIWLEGTVPEIASNAFEGSGNAVIVTPTMGIKQWADEQEIPCILVE